MASPGGRLAVVFGGAGFVGRHLRDLLEATGYRVIVADLHPPVSSREGWREVDVRQRIDLAAAPDLVVNLAAVHRTPGHPDHEYYDTNVAGALNVTEWCERVGARTLAFTSSISVYGPSEEMKSESAALAPNTAYGRSKVLAERIHAEWLARAAERRLVIARPAVVFGPGEGGNFTRLARALERRRFLYPGRRDTIKGCGYVADLTRALLFGVEQADPAFTFNFCYPKSHTVEDICLAFHRVAGYPNPRMLPGAVVRTGLGALRRVPAGLRPDALDPDRVAKVTASTHVWPAALLEAGFEWSTDLESALRDWRAADPVGRFV